METLLITIVPSILILLFFVYSDRFKEPKKIIIITFLFGILITIPAGYLNDFIMKTFETESKIKNALLGGFFAGGLVEETLKFLVLYFYILKEKAFNEPMDAIVYGVCISLGFSLMETLDWASYIYVQEGPSEALMDAKSRAWSSNTLHAGTGILMGTLLSNAFFQKHVQREISKILEISSLFLPKVDQVLSEFHRLSRKFRQIPKI